MGRARAGDRARRIHRCRRPAEKLQTASVGLCCSVKTVVHAVFTDHADRICRSPERPDLPISKEEACGHVIGSLCIGELLAEEGRKIGKRVYNVRRGCRRERALAAIERDLQTACAERLRATSPESALKLPDHRSISSQTCARLPLVLRLLCCLLKRRQPLRSAAQIAPKQQSMRCMRSASRLPESGASTRRSGRPSKRASARSMRRRRR